MFTEVGGGEDTGASDFPSHLGNTAQVTDIERTSGEKNRYPLAGSTKDIGQSIQVKIELTESPAVDAAHGGLVCTDY